MLLRCLQLPWLLIVGQFSAWRVFNFVVAGLILVTSEDGGWKMQVVRKLSLILQWWWKNHW